MLQQRMEHRGYEEGRETFFALEQLQHLTGVEALIGGRATLLEALVSVDLSSTRGREG